MNVHREHTIPFRPHQVQAIAYKSQKVISQPILVRYLMNGLNAIEVITAKQDRHQVLQIYAQRVLTGLYQVLEKLKIVLDAPLGTTARTRPWSPSYAQLVTIAPMNLSLRFLARLEPSVLVRA